MEKLLVLLVLLVCGMGYSQENPAKMIPEVAPTYEMTPSDFREWNSFAENDLNVDSVEQETFKIFNEYRKYVGASELVFDTTLQKVAFIQCKYISTLYKTTHTNPDPNLRTPKMRLSSVDVNNELEYVSEIVARNEYTFNITRKRTLSQQILDLFYYSVSHKEIIESSKPTKIGISIVKKENSGSYYVVVLFGK
jgi:uncharacterized protein YkwD